MLWAKDVKTNFSEKFPHLDPSQTHSSKRLNEQWAQVSQAEKKMWKNRAAKMMKAGENMKNTAPPPAPKVPKKKRPKMKVTHNLEGLSEQKTKVTGKTPPGKAKGRGRRKGSESSFNDDNDLVIAPPPKTTKTTPVTKAPAKGKKTPSSKESAFNPKASTVKNGRKSPGKSLANLNVATMRAMSNNFSKTTK